MQGAYCTASSMLQSQNITAAGRAQENESQMQQVKNREPCMVKKQQESKGVLKRLLDECCEVWIAAQWVEMVMGGRLDWTIS